MKRGRSNARRIQIEDMVEEYNVHLLPGEERMTRREMVELVDVVGFSTIKERKKGQ